MKTGPKPQEKTRRAYPRGFPCAPELCAVRTALRGMQRLSRLGSVGGYQEGFQQSRVCEPAFGPAGDFTASAPPGSFSG